ncbi:MAG: TonB-dependent receptor [Candidatus Aminicenantes bacterium]|nr:TonB-dependent receptor [Candidatus Aminicenantes bacterium]
MTIRRRTGRLVLTGVMCLLVAVVFAQEGGDKKDQEKKRIQTEEIVVVAERPGERPLASTTRISREWIETTAARDLSDILSYASGTYVSSGAKNEHRLKIRGFQTQRITLLFDGIPVYEPYFNAFDLKTFPAAEIEEIKIVKGASSVLYGPNTLGGLVNVITRRPESRSFSLSSQMDSNGALDLSVSGGLRRKNLVVSLFGMAGRTDHEHWRRDGVNLKRDNSDYERSSVLAKVYYYPGRNVELLFEVSAYRSSYGIPAAVVYYRPRTWRFRDWDRYQANLGGTFSLFKTGSLKFRAYAVRHFNVLDAYTDSNRTDLQWESTFKNSSVGAFVLGDVPVTGNHRLQFSLNMRDDRVNIQDDTGLPWDIYAHKTQSLGVEGHISLSGRWMLLGGVSADRLNKGVGAVSVSINPLLGVKFSPMEDLKLHLSLSQKSRSPSMKSLYGSDLGNPFLLAERGTNVEFGWTYEGGFSLSGAVFHYGIRDMIDIVRLPDGRKTNRNVGRADITGFEADFRKSWRRLALNVNYTFLHGRNRDEDIPLDLLPASQLNFTVDIFPMRRWTISIWGLAASRSETYIFDERVEAPGYAVVHARVSVRLGKVTVFLKGENLLDAVYVTEPGYPMKSRTVALGFRFGVRPQNYTFP